MRHITILYGDDNTGKTYLCTKSNWTVLTGTAEEIRATLEANITTDEFGVPLDTAEDQGILVGPVRSVIHEFAKANGYIVRYADLRVVG